MGEKTNIAWTRSTRNFWSGCTKIGPGCEGCYAEAFSRRVRGANPETGEATNWGPGERVFHGLNAEKDVRKWNKLCALERGGGKPAKKGRPAIKCFTEGWTRPGFWPVFINSFSDTFDNAVPDIWRGLLWTVIEECEYLDFQLVTKRIGNVASMVPDRWLRNGFPDNVRLIITVCNQEEADRDIPKLLALPCKNGISYEPALTAVDWRAHLVPQYRDADGPKRHVQWVIVGGESGSKARPFNVEWARSTIAQCKSAAVPCFVKQLGSLPVEDTGDCGGRRVLPDWPDGRRKYRIALKDRAGADPAEWPEDLRIQQFPE